MKMTTRAQFSSPIDSSRVDCPAHSGYCFEQEVNSDETLNFVGADGAPYLTYYFFSNSDSANHTFQFGVTYITSSASVIYGMGVLIATVFGFMGMTLL